MHRHSTIDAATVRRLLWLCLLPVLGACGALPLDAMPELIGEDSVDEQSIQRDAAAPVQTDSLVFHFTAIGPNMFAVRIPFHYRNETGRTISIVNCLGLLSMVLEKRVDGQWQTFYVPVLPACLSAPITIAAGAVYQDTLTIIGSPPGQRTYPEFASANLNGEFRLQWHSLVHDYDMNRQGFGNPVGPFRSNAFLLVAPGGAP